MPVNAPVKQHAPPQLARRPPRLLSPEDLRERGIKISRVQLWRMVKAGEFPRPVKVTPQRNAWHEEDIDRWIAARPPAVSKTEAAGAIA